MQIVHVVSNYSKYDGVGGIVRGLHFEAKKLGIKSFIFSRRLIEVQTSESVFLSDDLSSLRKFILSNKEPDTYYLYHFGVFDPVIDKFFEVAVPFNRVFYYHNVTPGEFYKDWDVHAYNTTVHSRNVLKDLLNGPWIITGDSQYNIDEIKSLNKPAHKFLPPVLPTSGNSTPEVLNRNGLGHKTQPTLLFVGRMAPNKRQDILIQLVSYLKNCGIIVKLILVGRDEGLYSKCVHSNAYMLGVTSQIEYRNGLGDLDMNILYRYSDFFIIASEHEGFCIPIIESLQNGCLPLSRPFAAVKELLNNSDVLCGSEDVLSFFEFVKNKIEKYYGQTDDYNAALENARMQFQKNTAAYSTPAQLFNLLQKEAGFLENRDEVRL